MLLLLPLPVEVVALFISFLVDDVDDDVEKSLNGVSNVEEFDEEEPLDEEEAEESPILLSASSGPTFDTEEIDIDRCCWHWEKEPKNRARQEFLKQLLLPPGATPATNLQLLFVMPDLPPPATDTKVAVAVEIVCVVILLVAASDDRADAEI